MNRWKWDRSWLLKNPTEKINVSLGLCESPKLEPRLSSSRVLFLILNICVTPCLCLRREVESCWSRAEGSKDCGGPQFLVVFAMHCSLHFKYLDFFKGIEHLRGEDRDADWLDLLLKVTEDTGDTFDMLAMLCVTAERPCKILLQIWGRRLYYSEVPASISVTAQV